MQKIVLEAVIIVNELWVYYAYLKQKKYPIPNKYIIDNRLKKNNNITNINNKSLDSFIKYITNIEKKNNIYYNKDNNSTNSNNTMEFL